MKLIITGKKVNLSEALREHIERRVYFALSRFSPRISRVSVTVEDVNGPRGGIDKRCQILVKLDRMEELKVETTDAEIHDAVAAAADRVGRAVQRQLDRRRTVSRSDRRSENHDGEEEEPTTSSV